MKTFKDLISKYNRTNNTQYISDKVSLDRLERMYNNLWGAVTDTHMSTTEDGYIITGSKVSQQEIFLTLLTADRWEDIMFPHSFKYYMSLLNLVGEFRVTNGQIAFVIRPWNESSPNPIFKCTINNTDTTWTHKRFYN